MNLAFTRLMCFLNLDSYPIYTPNRYENLNNTVFY